MGRSVSLGQPAMRFLTCLMWLVLFRTPALDPFVAGVGDVEDAAASNGDPARFVELAGARAFGPERGLEFPARAELLHAVVAAIDHDQVAGGFDLDVVGLGDLALPGSRRAEANVGHEAARGLFQLGDPVGAGFGDPDVVGGGIETEAARFFQRGAVGGRRFSEVRIDRWARFFELDDAVFGGVGDPDAPFVVHGDAVRRGEFSATQLLEICARSAELLNPGVAGVGHPEVPVGSDRNAARFFELTVARSGRAELAQVFAFGVELLDAVVFAIDHVDVAAGIDGRPHRPIELAVAGAGGAKGREEGKRLCRSGESDVTAESRAFGVGGDDSIVNGRLRFSDKRLILRNGFHA